MTRRSLSTGTQRCRPSRCEIYQLVLVSWGTCGLWASCPIAVPLVKQVPIGVVAVACTTVDCDHHSDNSHLR